MVICLERGADLHVAQLMPLPLTVSCFSKIQIGFTFLVPARARVRACVCSALSPLSFVIVMEAISRELRVALPWELLYAYDSAVIAEIIIIIKRRLILCRNMPLV